MLLLSTGEMCYVEDRVGVCIRKEAVLARAQTLRGGCRAERSTAARAFETRMTGFDRGRKAHSLPF